jgi:hypothetical protein
MSLDTRSRLLTSLVTVFVGRAGRTSGCEGQLHARIRGVVSWARGEVEEERVVQDSIHL